MVNLDSILKQTRVKVKEDITEDYKHASVMAQKYWRGYTVPPHIQKLEDILEAYVINDTIQAPIAILNYPPRHGKTLYLQNFIAFYMGTNPDSRVAYLSHSHKIAEEKAIEIKDIFTQMYPHLKLRGDSKAKSNFRIKDHNGGLYSTGIDGSITGMGFQLIVTDDPHSGEAGVQSTAIREKVLSTFDRTIRTRLEPNGKAILIQTRWHPDDLTGHLLDKHGDKLIHMNVPALNEQGVALWPERFNEEALEAIKFDIGTAPFQSQFMQQPYLEGGQELKWDWVRQYDKRLASHEASSTILVYDPAISEKETADNSVLALLRNDPRTGHIQVQDIWYGKWNFNKQLEMIQMKYHEYSPDIVLIEEIAYQKALRDYLSANTMIPVKPISHGRISKETRIRTSLVPPLENGQLTFNPYILEDKEFELEYLQFPKARRDDIVDAISMGVAYLKKFGSANPYTQSHPSRYYQGSSGYKKWQRGEDTTGHSIMDGERTQKYKRGENNPYSISHS